MTAPEVQLTEQQRADLDIARGLAAAGIPVFVARPDPEEKIGFKLPEAWQHTTPDPAVVDRWQPGMALCAVMGCGLDVIDVDPRNGGDASVMNGSTPRSYATAVTPSGGVHSFIRTTGAGSRDNIWPGIDVKGGMPDGTGRGFAFIAPTERPSKATGEVKPYRWVQPPDVERLTAQGDQDDSGAKLAEKIRTLKADSGVAKVGGPDFWREFLLSREPQAAAAADKAITEKLREVAAWKPESGAGFRTTLLRAALTLGGYVGGDYLDEDDARERLRNAVCEVWTAPDADDELWIEQGLSDGQAQPFYVYTAADELAYATAQAGQGEGPGSGGEPPWTIYSVIGLEPFDPAADGTDQGLAEQVAMRMYPALRYGVDTGRWLVRGREMWADYEDMSSWAVSTVARLMPLGQTPVPKALEDRTEAHWQAVRRQRFMDSGGSGKIERKLRAIVRNADHPAGIEVASLDTDPEILWAGGRPFDLRASIEVPTLAEIDPATPHLRTALVAPALVDTPAWDRFVAAVWPDPELRAWALRVLSIALAGYPDAALPVLYGPERTGKTSLVQLVVDVLGSYAHAADPRLLAGADNAHASVVYALKGRRLSFIDEGPRRGHLAAERLKQLTGGGVLTGNAMRSNPITFRPTHTLVMTTNDEPPVTDPALRARMRIIPCESDQAEVRAARKAITPAVWRAEAPGVLARLMAECAAWLEDPDTASTAAAPQLVRGAVDEMAAGQDPVREWVEMCTVPADPGTPGRELYRRFRDWYDLQSIYRRATPPTETMFGRTLNELGYPGRKTGADNRVRRPLSVLNGPGAPAPWEPMLGGLAEPGGTGGPEGSGESAERSADQPSAPQNPSSTRLFSSSSEGTEGTSHTISNNNNTITTYGVQSPPVVEKYGDNGGETLHPPASAEKTRPDQGWKVSPEPPPEPSRDGAAAAGSAAPRADQGGRDFAGAKTAPDLGKLVDHAEDADEDAPQSRKVTNSDVARRANEQGITKAEARAQLKEEQRQAAVRAAAGEVLALPAAVDRAGHTLPLTLEQAATVVRTALGRSGALTVDVETSGYPVGHPDYRLRSVQLGDSAAAVVFDPDDPAQADLVRELLAEAPKLHAHSATADLVPLAHAGLVDADAAWERMHDTVIPAKLADPHSTDSDPGLKQLSGAKLGEHAVSPAAEAGRKAVFKAGKWLEKTEVDTPLERSGWAQIETGSVAMLRYAASDVLDTAALPAVLPAPDPAVYERERLAQRMTARITDRGVPIAYARVLELSEPARTARAEAAGKVRELGAGSGLANPGSAQQIAAALTGMGVTLPKTKTGRDSVPEDVLAKIAAGEGAAAELSRWVLAYREHDKALGTYLDPYRLLCERGDGRVRPTIYTIQADTGRMSSVRPNLQNIPREGGFRSCIAADPGYLMIGADFSGVEIRVAAALSQDPTLLRFIAAEDAFNAEIAARAHTDGTTTKQARAAILAERGLTHGGDGDGLHWVIARQVWGEDAQKRHRYAAKRIVFGRLYGGGIETLAKQAGVSEADTQAAVDVLDALTPQLSAWSAWIRQSVKQGHAQFRAYSGRVIHLPADRPHAAPNYCIQGTARELLVDALVRWNDTRWRTCTLLPVHDELDVWVPEDEAEAATAELVRCMATELYGVQIVADPSEPSTYWQDSA